MSQALRILALTIPLSLIHIGAFLSVFAAAFYTFGAAGVESSQPGGRYLLEWVPLEWLIPYTARAWGIMSIVLAVVAYLTKPINYIREEEYPGVELVTCLVMMLSAYVMTPVAIALVLMSSPFLLLSLAAFGPVLLLPVGGFAILALQNLINVPWCEFLD